MANNEYHLITKLNITPSATIPLSDTSSTQHSSGIHDNQSPELVVTQSKRGLESKKPAPLSLTPVVPSDSDVVAKVAESNVPHSSGIHDNQSPELVVTQSKRGLESKKPPPLSLTPVPSDSDVVAKVAEGNVPHSSGNHDNQSPELVVTQSKRGLESKKPPPLSLTPVVPSDSDVVAKVAESNVPHSTGKHGNNSPVVVEMESKRGLESKKPPPLSLTPVVPSDSDVVAKVAEGNVPHSSGNHDNQSPELVVTQSKRGLESKKPPPLSLTPVVPSDSDVVAKVAESNVPHSTGKHGNNSPVVVEMESKKGTRSKKPPPLVLGQINAPLADTSKVAQTMPHSSGNHDNQSPEPVVTQSKRGLESKRPPPLSLTPVVPSNTGVGVKVAQNNVPLCDTYKVSQNVTSFPDTYQKVAQSKAPLSATLPKVAQSTTPLSATSLPAPSPYFLSSPKYSPNSKTESVPSKVSPSHPYYSATRQHATSTATSKFTLSDSTHMPLATSSSSGMHAGGKKNFKPTLNLGGSSSTDLTFRSKRPPSIHSLTKRRSTIYTREQLQELVQIRASEAKMENISDEHKAAIQKFLDDKASILKCGELSITDLEKQKELGFGNSGNVSKKRHLSSGVIMACKTIKLEIKEAQRNAILSELHVLHDCSSPYIVGFFGSFCYNMDLEICMEYMDGGSLDQVIRHWGRIEEDVIAVITRAVLFGMYYLYRELNILHRDVKPSNILLNSLGEVKMCDFGVSKKLLDTKGVANTFVGTRSYMAPERLIGSDYTVKSDLWSLGISLIEMAIGKYPIPPLTDHQIDVSMSLPPAGCENQSPLPPDQFDHPIMAPFEMLQYVAMEEPPTMPRKYFSLELCEFVEFCLMREPDQRASVEELIDNSFITSQPKVNMSSWAIKVAQHGID